MAKQEDVHINLDSRLALTAKEAARALGVSERTLRDHIHEIPHVYLGRRIVLPVRDLRDWLSVKAREPQEKIEAIADEIIRDLQLR